MVDSINEELDKIKNIIGNEENKEFVIQFINKLLNIKLTDFKYEGIITLKKIVEYDFSVLKIIGNFKNKEYELYIRIIKGGEIKKSVFCCWSLLEEENSAYIQSTNDNKMFYDNMQKVLIKDNIDKKYHNKVYIALKGDISYNFEVNFIELEKIKKFFDPKSIEDVGGINLRSKDILLIMVRDK